MLLVLDPGSAGLPEKWVELECASIYTIDLSVPEVKERDVGLKNGRLDVLRRMFDVQIFGEVPDLYPLLRVFFLHVSLIC